MKNYKSGSACEVFVEREKKRVIKRVYYTNEGIENGHKKLIHEINYLKQMNEECEYFPKVLETYYKDDYLCAEIEYLFEGESFADLIFDDLVNEEYLDKSLEVIMKTLFDNFYKRRTDNINHYYWDECYIDRTIRRLNVTLDVINQRKLEMSELKNCIRNGITVNGINYASVYKYMDYIKKNKEYLNIIQPRFTYRSHHDLIAENILISRGKEAIKAMKMIDPRGESETGVENRHYIYDMGKMVFGLDCYSLFRRAYRNNNFDNFYFKRLSKGNYELKYNKESLVVKKLICLQKKFLELYFECCNNMTEECENAKLQLIFSAACMYIPDIPCRVIDEEIEELCLLFYARGCMFLHELMLELYGKDELSSDVSGNLYNRWELK